MNKRRKGALSIILPWMKRFGIFLLVVTFGIWLGAWLLISGGFQKIHTFTHTEMLAFTTSLGFRVESFQVEGRVHSDAKALKSLVDVEKGAPLFAFNPAKLKTSIEKLEWVKYAVVERRLPGTVYIRLQEHVPLALWQEGGTLKLLNEEGGVINTKRLAPFKDLMIVMGDDAPEHAPDLLADLQAEPALSSRVTSAKWMDGRRWDLLTKEGVTIKLPETDQGLALRKLAEAAEKGKIFDKDITAIDLREPDRMIMRTRPGALQEYKAGQAEMKGEKAI
jgi:cell division protein FtsQ